MGEGSVGGPGADSSTGGVGVVGAAPDADAARLRDRRERHRPNTKIICRRLPPTMTEESFLDQVSPIPEHDYFYFAKPDVSLAPNLFCRAYINFVNVDDIYNFRDKFDEYIFLDDKGNEYPAIVEYAPFQRIIKKRRKKDVKCGTLESDPAYMEFLDSLKETDSDSREPKMEYSYQPTEEKKETVTPLLEFLAARKRDERRRREEKQRRRPRNRMSKDDEYDDFKQTKYKDDDDRDDDASPIDSVEIKETQFQGKGRIRTYKEQRRSTEDHHKRNEYNKKGRTPNKDMIEGDDDDKINRKEKRDRQRETYREKYKEKDKFYDVKKEKYKSDKRPVKVSVYKELDEKEQDKLAGSSTKTVSSSFSSSKSGEKPSNVNKGPPISSKIKPFTQLPQYKPSDLTKVIDEMGANLQKSDSNKSENDNNALKSTKDNYKKESDTADAKSVKTVNKHKESHEKSECLKMTTNKESKSDSSFDNNIRRNSLESKQKGTSSDESVLRRNKSLDEKSHDSSAGDDKKSYEKNRENDPRSERRIRNKDRPSIVIYQPGMGKFSKQRIEREKDPPKSSDINGKTGSSSASSSNSVNSQDLVAEE